MNYWSTVSAVLTGIAIREVIVVTINWATSRRRRAYLYELLERIEELDEESSVVVSKKTTKKK